MSEKQNSGHEDCLSMLRTHQTENMLRAYTGITSPSASARPLTRDHPHTLTPSNNQTLTPTSPHPSNAPCCRDMKSLLNPPFPLRKTSPSHPVSLALVHLFTLSTSFTRTPFVRKIKSIRTGHEAERCVCGSECYLGMQHTFLTAISC